MGDPGLDSIMAQYLNGSSGGSGGSAPTPTVGGGPTSQAYWPGTKTSKAANKAYKVYLGPNQPGYDPGTSRPIPASGDQTMTESDAIASINSWSPQKLGEWRDLLVQKGLLKSTKVKYQDLVNEWAQAVQGAAQAYTIGGNKVTPYDMVDLMSTVTGATPSAPSVTSTGLGGTSVTGTSKQTETDKVVDHISNVQASQIVRNAFEQQVGRAPTDAEAQDFASRLHSAIQANPTVTQTSATVDGQGNVVRNSTSTGGFGGGVASFADAMAQQDAMQNPDYGAYQASTTYFNALQNAIKAAV